MPRLQGPYTGDFNGMALYWRATGGTVGTATYGEQVKDYVMPDGHFGSGNGSREWLFI